MTTPTPDIDALIEAGAQSMYGPKWSDPDPAKRPGDKMKDVWRSYARDALKPALSTLASQKAEIERLRDELAAALEPFVRAGRAMGAFSTEAAPGPFWFNTRTGHREIDRADFERARATLASLTEESDAS